MAKSTKIVINEDNTKTLAEINKNIAAINNEIHAMNQLAYALLIITCKETDMKPDQVRDIVSGLFEEYDSIR